MTFIIKPMSGYQLAQLNIGIIKGAMDSTVMSDFAANLDRINMSVWQDVTALNDYVYRSAHGELMRRRKEWFERMDEAFLVLWWVPSGHRPTVAEAMVRLELLREKGPTPQAFTFRYPFGAPDETLDRAQSPFEDECPAA